MKHGAKVFVLVMCICFFAPRSAVSSEAEPEVPRIFGIATLIEGTNSVQVTNDFQLSGLDLIPGAEPLGTGVTALSVDLGSSFYVSDHHHVVIQYKLLAVANGSALLEESDSTHFPGNKETRPSSRRIHVRSYEVGSFTK